MNAVVKKFPERFMLSSQLLLVVVMVGMVVGCAHVKRSMPTLSIEENAMAKTMVPPEGKGLIYIIRPYDLNCPHQYLLKINGKRIGVIGGDNYYLVVAPPGNHDVTYHYRGSEVGSIAIDVLAGSKHYVTFVYGGNPFFL